MSEPFVGQIQLFAGTFAPRGYALCNGQQMTISQNTALFAILGVTYGGNGSTNFNLPNLQGSVPVQAGQGAGLSNYYLGSIAGTETVTLDSGTMPAHTHNLVAQSTAGTQTASAGQQLAAATTGGRTPTNANMYSTGTPTQPIAQQSVQPNGGSGAHNNMMPYLALNYIIALVGVFPQRP